MKRNGLVGATTVKKWRLARPDVGPSPDLFDRAFIATEPNQAWVADMTEFPTSEGKLHLAAIRDLFHRGIVGWATSGHPDSSLAVEALNMAMIRTGQPGQVVHHSDKGSAYTSLHFASVTGNSNVRSSFGSTGDAYDNPAMETVWARLKSRSPGSAAASTSRPGPKHTTTCSSSSKCSTTVNATKHASAPHTSRLHASLAAPPPALNLTKHPVQETRATSGGGVVGCGDCCRPW
jgi:hypothetical protein